MTISKALIIPAAGAGQRMQQGLPKPYIKLNGVSILEHTLQRFSGIEGLRQIVVATAAGYMNATDKILSDCVSNDIEWSVIEGGSERQYSVYNALQQIGDDIDLVIIHDAVRPFIKPQYIEECCVQAVEFGAAVAGVPAKDTIKLVDERHLVIDTPERKKTWQIHTPQIFRTDLLKQAYQKAKQESYLATDDASLVEWFGEPVKVVKANRTNIKITYPQDLELARLLLQKQKK